MRAVGWRAVRSVVAAVLLPPTGHPVHAIYGTVLAAGLIAAQDPDQSSATEIAVAVAATVLVFWLAHGYAHAVGRRFPPAGDVDGHAGHGGDGAGHASGGGGRVSGLEAAGDPLDGWSGTCRALAENWPVARSAFPLLVVLMIARGAGATVGDAQVAALWTSLVLLTVWGHLAGRAGGLRRWRLAVYTAGSALLGLALIGLEVAIH